MHHACGAFAVWLDGDNHPPAAAVKGQGRKPLRAWGGTPKTDAAAWLPKRANSPQGYEASGSGTLQRFFDRPGVAGLRGAFAIKPQRKRAHTTEAVRFLKSHQNTMPPAGLYMGETARGGKRPKHWKANSPPATRMLAGGLFAVNHVLFHTISKPECFIDRE